jgi:N-acetylgalactosamine-N,N'-diacetylbacillosaminyl-diphospho-undecaprenol 4-alpha-N-acetylgalactosaminyltransferase
MVMKRRVYPKADLVLCNSSSALDEMIARFSCSPDRVRVVKNPIPLKALREAAAGPSAIDKQSLRPYFLCVSRLCEGKGIEDLLEARRTRSPTTREPTSS